MTTEPTPQELVKRFTQIGRRISARSTAVGTLPAVTQAALELIPGAHFASITRGEGLRFWTVGATENAATAADALQYELGGGPSVDAVLRDRTFRSGDIRCDSRWPEWGPSAASMTGARSVMCVRLQLEQNEAMAGLNLYSRHIDAFAEDAELVGMLLATHGALALALDRAAYLQEGLASNRQIGIAMGVLMQSHGITMDEAFDLLRISSQQGNVKLVDVARTVYETGRLEAPRGNRPGRSRRRRADN